MTDLIEALWDLLIENSLLRWFFIGLLIGLVLVGSMVWNGSSMDAGDAVMGIVASGVLVLGLRLVLWFVRS
ncbi:hypothetical protein [Azospirillum sp. TSO22-1]|uniref:hypothetical protein n=1 Tax=Azospirillum sp. TSO22-1 TaxID=716789 RepID=UPI000D60D188|nr:hypothetical protein [Azospirillum sp. TSO22-1]PWC53597.1 hypothetical protein TSO221_10195 [Azospirillum sp. TSO22-1]